MKDMKKILLSVFVVFILYNDALRAQELTVEYDFSYGTFCMREFKGALNDAKNTGQALNSLKITDNFPGNWINQAKIGLEFKQMHQFGLSFEFMNTAGQLAVSDYSGSYKAILNASGTKLGAFYRITPKVFSGKTVRPYFLFSGGIILNDVQASENLDVYEEKILNTKEKLTGINTYVEPAIGVKIRLHEYFAVNVSGGYQFDLSRNLKNKVRNKEIEYEDLDIAPTWSGLRFSAGVIMYISLK
jgi:hypothetical protein